MKLLLPYSIALAVLLGREARAGEPDPWAPERFGAQLPDPSASATSVPSPGGAAPAPPRKSRVLPLRLSLAAGGALLRFSGKTLRVPIVPVVAASESIGFDLGAPVLRLGLSQVYVPVLYRSLDGRDGMSFVAGMLAELGLVYPVRRFELGLSLAPGVLWWMGLAPGNPFTLGGASADGPVPMPTLQLALTAGFRVTERFALLLDPSFTASTTTSPGLARSISTFMRWNLVLGVALTF